MKVERINSLEQELETLAERIVNALPAGCAIVRVKRRPQIKHDGISISITPLNPAAARIVIDAKDGDPLVGMVFGMGTRYELFGSDARVILVQTEELCRAILDGKLTETVWQVGAEVVKCKSKITVAGNTKTLRYYGQLAPLDEKKVHTIHYAPYCAPPADADHSGEVNEDAE